MKPEWPAEHHRPGRPRADRGPGGLPTIDDHDVYIGFPFGCLRRAAETSDAVVGAPSATLRDELRTALERSPCLVAFSGGRDSSLLLAVASELAAREGLDQPVAVTLRYPGDADAEESAWQHLVIRHLRAGGLRPEWTCRDVETETDLIGPITRPVLRAHTGPTFPPALGATLLLTGLARGGALVTGNFGDEVLGGHRAAVIRTVLRRRCRGMTRPDWIALAFAASPRVARRSVIRGQVDPAPWLRAPLRTEAARLHVDDAARRPLRWNSAVRAALSTRAARLGALTRNGLAAANDCTLVEPLGSPALVESLARFGGRFGGASRSNITRMLAGGLLLPEEVIRRRSKAYFNRSRFGPVTREFARRWDGSGVDDALVCPEELRRAWLSDMPSAATAMLLQRAWLAQDGGTA